MRKILIHGYDKNDYEKLKSIMFGALNDSVELIAGSNEDLKICEILHFDQCEAMLNSADTSLESEKLMMFAGLEQEEILRIMNAVPRTSDVFKRPLFCGLTKHNVNWTVKYLLNHLIEEREEIRKLQQK